MAAAAITWLLVKISPSADRMMPEPSSDWRPRSVSNMTTLGTTLAATCSTDPGGMFAAGMLGAALAATGPPLGPAGARLNPTRDAAAPPMPADTTAIVTAPMANMPARGRWRTIPGGGVMVGITPGIRPGRVPPNAS
ncbi:Uncharacterised protein [Mycobacterium tuberculosis]|nr:Uncharacterised protein [Mycobacterium tuberculosis]